MIYLSAMCRNRKIKGNDAGFSVSSATAEQLEWATMEIEDRMDLESRERGE
jgi:hypothetical protein